MRRTLFFITLFFVLLTALVAGSLAGGQALAAASTVLKVGASPTPHAQILELIKPILAKEGITLQIIEFQDYVQPNLALAEGELDANYFQHIPYLEQFCRDHNLDLTYIAKVHIEPMGIYSRKIKSLKQLRNRAVVAIPNDPTNGGRALLLLQRAGLIELREGAGLSATELDIAKNPKGLQIRPLEAAQLPRALADVDIAVINTNYALPAKLVPTRDALFMEDSESPYVNVLAVRTRDKNNPALQKLARALTSNTVKDYILKNYKGDIVPAF
ncbi:MAG TPA: MetQ/NlpA family ABC transporter substrate-binding protein [Firmicutes bacterium]|nr:MetQ/NlpA family ABC transporter substrate-binding protein [Bacillota bacterium]